ncbi:hypothetical protein [Pseudomonas sp. T1.Ur]|uniref:hypothetical protein n=1 Tax=Pseudomonas sp. T1.Ur TaxID=2928704 RepID=UPI00201D55C1|nr:hypothetical protein [Pseudomonas sp. T1.Ur]MCL6702850.1 hypothetical protein [Pseudomonas sp. T1.Ur]
MVGTVGGDPIAACSIRTIRSNASRPDPISAISGDAINAYSIGSIRDNAIRVGVYNILGGMISTGPDCIVSHGLRASFYCPAGDSKCAANS